MRREQLFVHLCICAFSVAQVPKNHRKKTNTQKTPSDGTVRQCSFVYLFNCVFTNKITALGCDFVVNTQINTQIYKSPFSVSANVFFFNTVCCISVILVWSEKWFCVLLVNTQKRGKLSGFLATPY